MSPALPSQRGAELLAGGKALGEWILAGGQPERHQALLQTRLRWNAYWFEKHLARSRRNLENLPLAADPIILVGLWRTGSTALHARLSAASGCTTPLTWQCFRPASFALMPAPRTDLTVTRPMDDGKVSTFSPQEDEFASLLLGEPSVYRSFIDPRRLGEATALLKSWQAPHAPADSAAALSARWEDFLRTLVQQRPGRLLLKSPNHTFRMPWLNTRFPKAQFIWIVRPQHEVLRSMNHMWLEMIARYGLWPAERSAVTQFVTDAVRIHDEVLDWARSTLGDRLTLVNFSDAVGSDEPWLRGLLQKIGMDEG